MTGLYQQFVANPWEYGLRHENVAPQRGAKFAEAWQPKKNTITSMLAH